MPDRLLSRHAPDAAVALGDAGTQTLQDLLDDAGRLAAALPAGHITVTTLDRYRFAVALLAAWGTDRGVVLAPNFQPETVTAIAIEHDLTHVHDDAHPALPGLRGVHVDAASGRPTKTLDWQAPDPDRWILSLCTSGSTGPATMHEKTAGQLLGEASMLAAKFKVFEGHRVLATVPAHHIYGLLFSVLVPLAGGAAFVRGTPLHPQDIAGWAHRFEADLLVSTPAHLRTLEGVAPPLGVEAVVSSGAMLPAATGAMVRERFGVAVTEVLGSTETGGLAWRDADCGAVWHTLPGVEVSVNEEGSMLVDSPFLPPRAQRPYEARERIELCDGGFVHRGRADDIVKVGGKRVSPAEVAAALCELPGVDDAAVAARPTEGSRGVELVALVVAPGRSAEGLRAALEPRFDPTVIPRVYRHVAQLPRDERGKISREAVIDTVAATPAAVWNLEQLGQNMGPTRGGERLLLLLRIPSESSWVRGHFPTYPVVPGAILLQIASVRARMAWRALGELKMVQRLKFKRPIRPGETVQLKVDHVPRSPRAEFQYSVDGAICAEGSLLFVEAGR